MHGLRGLIREPVLLHKLGLTTRSVWRKLKAILERESVSP